MVKICGITNAEILEAVSESGADAVGFVVGVPSSPRHLSVDQVKNLLGDMPSNIIPVIVSRAQEFSEIENLFQQFAEEYIQVHFPYSDDSIVDLLKLDLERFIPALPVEQLQGLNSRSLAFRAVLGKIPFLILDGSQGRGLQPDYQAVQATMRGLPEVKVVIAGGLTPENVGEIIETLQPYGVDVSSGVESAPGVKDLSKIQQFVQIAKGFVI